MKTIITALAFIFCSLSAAAQQNYFIYIQTENKQPFYVKANDKLLNSSASGYIVVPKLVPGSYTITVGFPKDQWPQQTFPLVVGKADAGYLLKDFGTKGWGLFNIQTMEVAMAGAASAEKTDKGGDDLFTNALSGAANTNLKTAPVKTEPVAVNTVSPVKTEPASSPVTKNDAAPGSIEKISAAADNGGSTLTYVDKTASSADTVNVFIPAETKTADNNKSESPKPSKVQRVIDKIDAGLQKPVISTKENKTAAAPVKNNTEANSGFENKDKPVVSFNSDCRVIATADDFLKIRRRMTAETGDEAMIDAARKFFKLKCYSTEQIKNLSTLFLTDSGKYGFFDAAYPRVNDTHNFSALRSELHDEYYINRFNAMVRN